MTRANSKGFTLIELSIVLVVVGLIIGGIVVGRALIRNSELQAIITDVNNFKSAINTFRLKYGGLPGDIRSATTYLGSGVTNGNGNGQIDYNNGAMGEEYYAWNQLTTAGLISGTFNGTSTTSIPSSRLSGGLYRVNYQSSVYQKNGHMISFNAMNTTYSLAHNAILSPKDAYAIDGKIDDGLADRGRVMTFNPQGVPGCIDNYFSSPTGTYILTTDNVLCKMYFLLDY